ncbi:MAG: SLC13 family permease, partial [Fuerstiella sp.]
MGTSEPQAAARGNQAMKFAAGAIVLAAITILLMPTPEGMLPEGKRLIAVTILMAGLWVTQAIPLAATSLLPLVLFPVLGIQTAKEVSSSYINDNVFLYLGGFIIALGIERWHLHRRIALNVVRVVGVSPKRLVLGFLLATAGLSMWISNTATTLLMLPIALALLKTLDDEQSRNAAATGADARPDLLSKRLAVPLLLAIAYAASIGGLTTIIGTPTNNQAVGNYRKLFVAPVTADMKRDSGDAATVGQRYGEEGAVAENARRSQLDISVAQWMLACVPIGAIYLFVTWFVLTFRLPGSTSHDVTMKAELAKRLRGLGKATFAERMMLAVFVSTAVLWVFRQPLVIGT